MKSDREFIDGIYEKAKNYTTEENNTSLTTYKSKVIKPYVWQTLSCAAAMLLLCVAIDGISGNNIILQRNKQTEPTQAVQEMSVAFARYMPEQTIQTITVTGEISYAAPEVGYFLLTVEEMTGAALEDDRNEASKEISAQAEKEQTVIQVCYDSSMYTAEAFVSGKKVSLEVCEGDVYGRLSEDSTEAGYPVYTLQSY